MGGPLRSLWGMIPLGARTRDLWSVCAQFPPPKRKNEACADGGGVSTRVTVRGLAVHCRCWGAERLDGKDCGS
eukprot:NODE_5953_length_478_cov_67.559441_g4480_i0.p2 GENE.NODE_5953_length_478_cov_67.559441_g4480_i0~~NODE_5953_length_478_cov_67.559441_g4480_i0.p2  ORF type:complete len:73 (+),score=2.40 NODE_5953_length_478_cov_67.559441_g4480_i0:145-363(+)